MITRIPHSATANDTDYADAGAALLAFASDIAAGIARDGAPTIRTTNNKIVLTYPNGLKISYIGSFNANPYQVEQS